MGVVPNIDQNSKIQALRTRTVWWVVKTMVPFFIGGRQISRPRLEIGSKPPMSIQIPGNYDTISGSISLQFNYPRLMGNIPKPYTAAGGKFVAWPCLRFKKKFVGLKPIFESMTGRIVLSHVHVSTLRRTRSTEKLIFTGLASGGIITLE